MSVLKVVPIWIENSQLGDNIPKSFGLTTPNVLQLLSQPEELYVKLNILISKFLNSRKSSPYESHHLVDTFMEYNILVLRLQITTYKDELKKKKKKKNWFLCSGRIGRIPYDPIRSYMWSYNIYDPCAILNVLVRWDCKIVRSYNPN